MSQKRFCDNCEDEIVARYFNVSVWEYNTEDKELEKGDMDLCEKCYMTYLGKFFKSK